MGRAKSAPYIPEEHQSLGLLPLLRKNGGEVFSYPAELNAIDEILQELEGAEDDEGRPACLIVPYGMGSYDEYYALLESYAGKHREANPDFSDSILWLEEAIKRMNVKEDWSVVRYVGDEYDGDPTPALTKGRCYYWPCSKNHPVYEGVVDNEEFTSYLYPCDPKSWEIVLDPTGMAARALAGEADTVHAWGIEGASIPGSFEEKMAEFGLSVKTERKPLAFDTGGDGSWSASECDAVNVPCPHCGETFSYGAWTLVNAVERPDLAAVVRRDELGAFECPKCGYAANLVHPCLYVDPKHGLSAYLVPSAEMAPDVERMFDAARSDADSGESGRSRMRIVFDRHELAEKAIAAEAELDDRVIEILKIALSGFAKAQGRIPVEVVPTSRLLEVAEDGGMVFRIAHGSSRFLTEVPRGAYDLYEGALEKANLSEDQPYAVDREWAGRAIGVIEEAGVL